MKILFALILLIVTGSMMDAQTADTIPTSLAETGQGTMPEKVSSGLYRLSDLPADNVMISGSTTHFSDMTFRLESLSKKDGERQLHSNEEQILIIKEGEATVKMSQETKTIGPNSVFFLLPGEKGSITSESPTTRYYRMIYIAGQLPKFGSSKQEVSSFIIDYDELTFHESSKGGSHKYFNRSTAMCPYYEMHVTTLNPGLQSHKPHTHEAAEIILIIDGETEEEIGDKTYRGKKGDVYFLASNIPHAIRNIGEKQCQYFAFQWGASTKK